MKSIIKFGVVLVFAVMVLPFAAAVFSASGSYGPSDGAQLSNAACGNIYACNDSSFATNVEISYIMADGSTVAASTTTLQNASGANAKVVALDYYVDLPYSGTISMLVLPQSATTNLVVIPYVNGTHVSTNTSKYAFRTLTANAWTQFDVTTPALESYAQLGYVRLRLFVAETAAETIAEAILVTPPSPADFQVLAQGAAIGRVDSYLENEWIVVSYSRQNLSISNPVCVVNDVETELPMNLTVETEIETSEDVQGRHFSARWYANTSRGVQEGKNYEVECSLNIDGFTVEGLEQYIYFTAEKSMGQTFVSLMTYIGQIFGLIRAPVDVEILTKTVTPVGNTNVVLKTLLGADPVAATCNMTVADSAGQTVSSGAMSSFGNVALKFYNYSFPTASGAGAPFYASASCAVNDSSGNVGLYGDTVSLEAPSATASIDVTQIYEGTPSVVLLPGAGYAGQTSQVMAQFKVGSTSVTTGSCNLTVYYPANTTKLIDAQAMSYSGDDGIWQTTWVSPSFVNAYYPARVSCMSPAIGAMVVHDANVLNVVGGDATLRALS
jgi:hypothetical protein